MLGQQMRRQLGQKRDRALGKEEVTISVIVPVYNTEGYIRECLDSILAQRLDSIEVLCVDDGSTDASPVIAAEYAARDSRVRMIPQRPGGKGPGTARNTAMKEARGEFIARQDADDISEPQRLERQVAFLQAHPEVALLGTWFTTIDGEGLLASEDHFRRELGLDELERQPDGLEQSQRLYQRRVGRHGPLPCAKPAIADGRLYVRLKNGLACYDLRD
jgi:glycosyltransferase involved in cell wall biosynthesis